jgi:hypothetical protein
LKQAFLKNCIDQGYFIFPCLPNKKPCIENPNHTINLAKEYTYALRSGDFSTWKKAMNNNNAILCGEINRLLVVDIDCRNGGKYQWKQLLKKYNNGLDLNTFKVRTPSGGLHYYFSIDTDTIGLETRFNLRFLNNFLAGIDLLANNGYALLPFSVDINQKTYYPYSSGLKGYERNKLPPVPDWFKQNLKYCSF